MCINAIAPNARVQPLTHTIPECQETLEQLAGLPDLSTLDIKAGFHNIPIVLDTVPYTGIITNCGVYHCNRMQFGMNAAPAHFQFIMTTALGEPMSERVHG